MIKEALLTCFIVFSPGTNGDWVEKYWHEMAHCNGWVHPAKSNTFGEAYTPPKRFLRVYQGPIFMVCGNKPCSVKKAKSLCGGHFACQWFE